MTNFSDSIVTRLAALDACAVSDAMDCHRLSGVAADLHRQTTQRKIAGRALTVTVVPVGSEGGAQYHLGSDAITSATTGDVIVIDNRGRTGAAVWGGLLSVAAVAAGIAGVVIDGSCRDVDEIEALDLPVFAHGAAPSTARGRYQQTALNEMIRVCRIQVRPGDFVIADGTGVVFVPADRAGDIISTAEEIARREAALAKRLTAGEPPRDVLGSEYEGMVSSDG